MAWHGITDGKERVNLEIDGSLPVTVREPHDNSIKFFVNSEYGADMNQNAGTSGTPEKIHDGTDTSLWTATDIVGGTKTIFDSIEQSKDGTKSIKIDNAPLNDVFQIAKGSDIDMNNYASLTMCVYIDKDWAAGDRIEFYGWDTDTGTIVGDAVNLADYMHTDIFNSWHCIQIPLTDLNGLNTSTTLDAVRFKIAAVSGKSPKWYLDNIQWEEAGIPIKFSLTPTEGTWLHIESFGVSVVGNVPGTLADSTMPALSYDDLLGTLLPVGITYKREQNDETILTLQVHSLMDMIQLPGLSLTSSGSDGTNTFIKLDQTLTAPIVLKPENSDILSYTVNDNLSSLLLLRVNAGCKVEHR
jgi:hypothetical protein